MSSPTSPPVPPIANGPTRTLDDLQCGASVTIEELITALYVRRYNGAVTFDFRCGRPRRYALGHPKRGNIIVRP